MVFMHAKALLTGSPRGRVETVQADLLAPESLLREVHPMLDFSQPVAVLMLSILHFVSDTGRPHELVRRYTEALSEGSLLALSHITDEDVDPKTRAATTAVYANASAPVWPRTHDQIADFFVDLEITRHGVVDINAWPTEQPEFTHSPLAMYGGIGLKKP